MSFDEATKNLCHLASTFVLSADDKYVNQHGEKMITVNADLWMKLKQAVADKASTFPDDA